MADEEKEIKLTPKQEAFCSEYLIDLNASAAARRAGYSEDTAGAIGWENLKKPEIQFRLTELRQKLNRNNDDLAQKVIEELKKVGFSNIQDFIETGNSIKDLSTVDAIKAGAIAGIKKSVTTFGDGEGNEGEKTTVEFKLWDKLSALDKLGRHLGIFEVDNKQKSAVINVNLTDDNDDD